MGFIQLNFHNMHSALAISDNQIYKRFSPPMIKTTLTCE